MANTYIIHTYTSGDTIFSIPFPYQDPSYIHVLINDTKTTNFIIENGSVRITIPLSSGDKVTIMRITDTEELAVNFSSASGLTTEDINNANLQLFDIMQENTDALNRAIKLPPGSTYNTDELIAKIINVGDVAVTTEIIAAIDKINDIESFQVRSEKAVIQVEKFGAKLDGLTNDTAAFENAIKELKSQGGGTLIMGYGTPTVTKIELDYSDGKGVSLVGQGRYGTTIKKHGSGTDPLIHMTSDGVSRCTHKGFTLSGAVNPLTYNGFKIESC
jgi:hypothetical protein